MIGKRFGRWTVVALLPERYHSQRVYLCRCDCGTERGVPAYSLRSGRSASCGCHVSDLNRSRRLDLTGQRFGRLVVQKLQADGKWLCQCDCGEKAAVGTTHLRAGRTKSCGCLHMERAISMEAERKIGHEAIKAYRYEGTQIAYIRSSKVSKASTTGVRGVSRTKAGKYRAYIAFKRKSIHLGTYDTLEEAAEARKRGEERYFHPVIEAWEKERS